MTNQQIAFSIIGQDLIVRMALTTPLINNFLNYPLFLIQNKAYWSVIEVITTEALHFNGGHFSFGEHFFQFFKQGNYVGTV